MGRKNIGCRVLEETCESRLDEAEIHWIAYGRRQGWKLFNLTNGGSSTAGYVFTPEHCAKISAAIRGEKNGFYGRKHTPESIAKMSEMKMGEKNPFYGKKHTEEELVKMRKKT